MVSELHKPATPGPWIAEFRSEWPPLDEASWSIWREGDQMGEPIATLPELADVDADGIADLWGWIARAERFEEALREIAGSTDAIADLWQIAADALRDEGRL